VPSSPRTISSTLAVLAGLALVLASCSSSGGGSAAKPLTTAQLTAVVLKPGDLPATWKATAHDASSDTTDDKDQSAFASCVGGKNTVPDKVHTVHSQDYNQGQNSIYSNADTYKSSADVDSDVKIFQSSKAEACYTKVIKADALSELPKGSTIDKLDVTITPGSNGGPSNVVATVTASVSVTAQGQTVALDTTSVAIRGKTTEASIDFDGVGGAVPASVQKAAVAKVADRLSKA
jgi:hypothetical protein